MHEHENIYMGHLILWSACESETDELTNLSAIFHMYKSDLKVISLTPSPSLNLKTLSKHWAELSCLLTWMYSWNTPLMFSSICCRKMRQVQGRLGGEREQAEAFFTLCQPALV